MTRSFTEKIERRTIDPAGLPDWKMDTPVEWLTPVSYSNTLAEFIETIQERIEKSQKRKYWKVMIINAAISILARVTKIPEFNLLKLNQPVKYEQKIKEEDMPKSTLQWIKQRLNEPSTWMGFVTLAGVIGLTVSPELAEAVAALAASAIGLILVIKRERASREE